LLLSDLLEPLGFTVRTAADGAECLAMAADGVPDLFLLDLSMPGMSGWDLARALRQAHATVPIVMISADGRDLKHPPHESPHDGTLAKPIILSALLERIGHLLDLAWIAPPPVMDPADAELPRLSLEQIGVLREFAAIGHVSGLRTQLDVLEREMPGGGLPLARLRGLLAEFRLDAFLSALDDAMLNAR
jgi:CheY-like chemotaxis protein